MFPNKAHYNLSLYYIIYHYNLLEIGADYK